MKQALILFTRIPAEGKTKTRLGKLLPPHLCKKAHEAFLKDIGASVRNPEEWDLLIFYGNEGPFSDLRKLFSSDDLYFPQKGNNLGEKMDEAMKQGFSMGYDAVILTGTDLPELNRSVIRDAFTALSGHDLVIGPSFDGGYYLVGSRKPCSFLFEGQDYGGENVLENAIRAAEASGAAIEKVSMLHDIDEPEDLMALENRLLSGPPRTLPHTEDFLKEVSGLLHRKESS